MRGNRRRRQRSSTITLIVTFLLGIGIGYSLHYAQVEIHGHGQGEITDSASATLPGGPAETPAEGPADSSADVENLWPGRHLFIGIAGTALDDVTRDLIREYKPGGIVLREENLADPEQTRQLIRAIKEAAGQGLGVSALPLIAVAEESGAYNPLGLDGLPTAAEIGADERAAREAAREIAAACRLRDIAVVLAPVLEVAPEALQGVERQRFFSTDPATVAESGIAFANGLLEGGTLPIVKRYPGFGTGVATAGVTVLEEPNTQELARLMYPFSEAADAELPGLLVGHVMVPAVDTQSPASLSSGLVNKIIRDMWKYSGVIIADDVTANDTLADRRPEEAAAEALIAGCDAVLALHVDRPMLELISAGIIDVVNAGLLGKESLQASKTRLDAWRGRIDSLPVRIEPPAPVGTPLVIPAPEAPPAEPEASKSPEAADTAQPSSPAPEEGAAPSEAVAAPESSPEPADPPAPAEEASTPGASPAPAPEMPAPEATPAPEAPAAEPAPEAPVPEEQAAPEEPPAAGGRRAAMQPPGTRRLRHRIEKGDTLTSIAQKYGASVNQIKEWNSLEDNDIKWGYTLTVYVPEDPAPAPAEEAPAPAETDPAPAAPEATAPEPSAEAPATDTAAPDPETAAAPDGEAAPSSQTTVREHRLAPGETLEQLASTYGVSKEQIMEWNNLLVDTPEPGYLLKIHLPVAVEE